MKATPLHLRLSMLILWALAASIEARAAAPADAVALVSPSAPADPTAPTGNATTTAAGATGVLDKTQKLVVGEDKIYREWATAYNHVRTLFNKSNFSQLEKLANTDRATKAKFGNGEWKIFTFYDCLRCSDKDPDATWQLHAQILQAWEKAKPNSITARVAYAEYLTDYAGHARGGGYADTVTPVGWRLFAERLGEARKALDDAKTLEPKCPMWWMVRLEVALGQGGLDRAAYDKLFAEAKQEEPQFWHDDIERGIYLLPRWYGEPGDWEAAAEKEAANPNGAGWEGYTQVVEGLQCFHDNIFQETKASWPKTKMGFELMCKEYPDSLQVLSNYCKMACVAGDKTEAKALFVELSGRISPSVWTNRANFIKWRDWANS